MGNTEVVGSGENLLGGSNMGNLGIMGAMGNLGTLGNLVGSSEGTESRQNYWAPSFGNWPTHTVSKSAIYRQQINYLNRGEYLSKLNMKLSNGQYGVF